MIHRFLFHTVLLSAGLALGGCSSISKMTSGMSEKRNAEKLARNPDQMRISTEVAAFQPTMRVDVPQFSGLQTPLAGGNRTRSNTLERTIKLPRFTPVTVLSNNGRNALVQLKNGQRGYVPSACIESEAAILASAKPATPVQPIPGALPVDPVTGLPYDAQALYLPRIDPTDAPVDEAMLNNIDSIPLPESDSAPAPQPEGQEVDGIVIRNPSDPAAASGTAALPAPVPLSPPAATPTPAPPPDISAQVTLPAN
jgi:hypothetical protein